MDGLAPSLAEQILAKDASIHFIRERAIHRPDTTAPRDQPPLNLLGSFAEFERASIREWQALPHVLYKMYI